jgi:nucleotide-binding universal stress UspA family protein
MGDWKTFCCGLDFSEDSRLAMQEAAELTRRLDGQLELLHVHPLPPPTVAIEALPASANLLETVLRELRDTMAPWEEEAARIAGRPVRSTVTPGSPADEIVRFARERTTDVVVLGTHGRAGLARLLLGSVAERVVREAPCAVLVIRRRETARSAPTA